MSVSSRWLNRHYRRYIAWRYLRPIVWRGWLLRLVAGRSLVVLNADVQGVRLDMVESGESTICPRYPGKGLIAWHNIFRGSNVLTDEGRALAASGEEDE